MFHLPRIHCCLPGGLPAMLRRGNAIESMQPDSGTSRWGRRGQGPISALLLDRCAAGAQPAPPVRTVSPPDSIKSTGAWGPASVARATNTLSMAGMRDSDPRPDKLVGGTFRVSAPVSASQQ
jgi:hypothetical protein